MDAALEALYRGLARAGPGSDADTARALALVDCHGPLRILDIGCGPGAASLALLAALPEASVTATDLSRAFLADAADRAAAAGVAARFRTVEADMAALPFPAASFDILWSEGAAHLIGVPEALAAWRRLLVPGGRLAFSEAVWLSAQPAAAARKVFEGYPAMTDPAGVRQRIRAARWRPIGDFVLSPAAWAGYYEPLEARLAALDPVERAGPLAAEVRAEIAAWRAHGGDFGYGFFVAEA
jgi:SAM-dependent methyltransferase